MLLMQSPDPSETLEPQEAATPMPAKTKTAKPRKTKTKAPKAKRARKAAPRKTAARMAKKPRGPVRSRGQLTMPEDKKRVIMSVSLDPKIATDIRKHADKNFLPFSRSLEIVLRRGFKGLR